METLLPFDLATFILPQRQVRDRYTERRFPSVKLPEDIFSQIMVASHGRNGFLENLHLHIQKPVSLSFAFGP